MNTSLCELRSWTVFSPGTWTSSNAPTRHYDRAYCDALAANFHRLRRRFVPRLVLGHDREQRFASSLGFPLLGRVEGMTVRDNGNVNVFVAGIPDEIGGMINAGWFTGGSARIGDDMTLGEDVIPGPTLQLVALLGEEQAALADLSNIPQAVYANGEPVPPATSMSRWLEKMIELGAKNPNPR